MGFLSQVIPGLRDARTPLAVGAMWAIAIWITYFLIPKDQFDPSRFVEVVAPLGRLPAELLIGTGIMLIYAFGIFMEMISRYFKRVFFFFLLLLLLYSIYVTTDSANLLKSIALILFIVAIIFVINALRQYLKLRRDTDGGILANALEDSARQLAWPFVSYIRRIRPIFEPDYHSFQEILAREVEDYFSKNEQVLRVAAQDINAGVLSDAAMAMAIPVERLHSLASEEQKTLIERLEKAHLLQYRLRKDPELQTLVRQVVTEELQTSIAGRWRFAKVVFNMDPMRENLKSRLMDASVALRKENSEIYQEFDRLQSEGEFRIGISIPMMALLASISILTLDAMTVSLPELSLLIPVAASVLVGGSVHAAGTQKMKKANGLLYSCVVKEYVQLSPRSIFGSELFIPAETSSFTRVSEMAYEFKEFRTKLGASVIRKATSSFHYPIDAKSTSDSES